VTRTRSLEAWLYESATLDEVAALQRAGALPDEDLELLRAGKLRDLYELEDRYGGQQHLLQEHAELAATCQAMQRFRAAVAALALGIRLRGDGRPLPDWLAADLARALRGLLVAEQHRDPLG
jgi:hypothetical protein